MGGHPQRPRKVYLLEAAMPINYDKAEGRVFRSLTSNPSNIIVET